MLSGRRNNIRSRTPATKLDAGKSRRVCLSCTTTGDIMCPCSNKRRKVALQLPEEIIFNILGLLPAHILYNSMRFVCRQWSRIIHDPTFIREHLFRASYLLFAQPNSYAFVPPRFPPYGAHYVDVGERDARMRPLDLHYPSVDVLDCCDGLMVFCGSKDEDIICYVANPVTKQRIILPPLPLPPLNTEIPSIRLVPITSAEEYKVVYIYNGWDSARIFVVPLGKDVKWKELHCQHLSTTPINRFFPLPVAAKGYIHWTCDGNNTSILSLDLESETLHEVPAPLRHRKDVTVRYRKIKNELCCVHLIDFWSFSVLLLTDPKSGAWTKLYEVGGIPRGMIPVAWVRDGDTIVLFDTRMSFTVYNVKTRCSYSFKYCFPPSFSYHSHFESLYSFYLFPSHVESLVSLSKP